LPYAYSEASSDGSRWAKAYEDKANSLLARGLLSNDLSYAHANTPGVCVLKQMSLPQIPRCGGYEQRTEDLGRALRKAEEEDARASAAYAAYAARGPPSRAGSEAGLDGEVLPKQQKKTIGKPSICRAADESMEALRKHLTADDSYFTSEYRSKMWWKNVMSSQRHELKEHVRPYDNWTMFRDNAAKYAGTMTYPIRTY